MSSLQSVAEKVLPHHVVQKIIFDKHPTAEELFRDYAGFVRLNESRVSKEVRQCRPYHITNIMAFSLWIRLKK